MYARAWLRSHSIGVACGAIMGFSLMVVGAEIGADSGPRLVIGPWAIEHILWPLATFLGGAGCWGLYRAVLLLLDMRERLKLLETIIGRRADDHGREG